MLTQVTGRGTLPWTMLALTAAVSVGAWFIGRASARPTRSDAAPSLSRGWTVALASAAIASAIVMMLTSFGGITSPALPNQTYDGIFHQNAAIWIRESGAASPFELYRLTDPLAGNAFYPAAWHILAAVGSWVSGATMPTTFAALWVVMCAAIWLPGIVWATDVVVRPANRGLVLTIAALGASAFAAFPVLLLDWGTLYPTALATALAPAGLAIVVLVVRAMRGERAVSWPVLAASAAGWLAAAAFAHPRSLFSFAVIVLPYLAWQLGAALRRRIRDPRTRRRTLAWTVAAGIVVAALGVAAVLWTLDHYGAADRPISDRLNGPPAIARLSLWEGLLSVVGVAPVSSPSETPLPPAIALALALAVSVVIAAFRRDLRWLVVAYALLAVLYLLASTSNADFAKLATGLWYKDKYRLVAAIPIVAIPILAAGADRLATVLRARAPRTATLATAAIAMVVAALTWTGPTLATLGREVATNFAIDESDKHGGAIDLDAVAVLERASDVAEPGERLLGDPWDGAVLSWVVAGVEPVFPHFTGNWDPDRALLADRLDAAASDPEVCAALERLGVRYLFVDSEAGMWGGPPEGAQHFPGIDRATAAGVGEVVFRRGSAALVEITACRRFP